MLPGTTCATTFGNESAPMRASVVAQGSSIFASMFSKAIWFGRL
jgi:hypothetical protein